MRFGVAFVLLDAPVVLMKISLLPFRLLRSLQIQAPKVSSSYRPLDSLLKNVKAIPDLGGEFEAAPEGPNQSTHTIAVAPSSAPVLLDSREAYIAQIDSQDPAAELIRGLLSLLPANTSVTPVLPDQPAVPPAAEMTNAHEEAVAEVITVDDNSDIAPGNVHNIAQLKLHSPMHTEEHNTNHVFYFIGIITANGVRATFCVPGPNTETHRLGGAIDWLIFQNRPAGRMLQSLSPASDFHVGVSREPEDVDKEFMNYRRAFTEIGSLEGVLAAPADSPHLSPARPCQLLSALQQQLGEGQNVPVYVMYVYLSSIVAALPTAVPVPLASAPAIAPPPAATAEAYLDLHHAAARNTLQTLLNTEGYESAYKHCLIEREVMALCLRLGIVFARQITPAQVTLYNVAIQIHPQDVAVWMGVSSGHFATCRTDLASARRAHLLLRQLHQEVQHGLPVSPSFTSHFAGFLGTLNSLLGTRTLPAVNVHNGYAGAANTDVADVSAVRMKISALRVLVAEVKLRWPEQAERYASHLYNARVNTGVPNEQNSKDIHTVLFHDGDVVVLHSSGVSKMQSGQGTKKEFDQRLSRQLTFQVLIVFARPTCGHCGDHMFLVESDMSRE
ncbi:hypothetical protein R3P38DRAFT_3611990 [Favolaschia claudopus]|uniref:Uncharacterized protein n=1 Tax=Favolaschia claudopus TaxID=2862362 RepID=A0AAW0A5U4_9AGAR